MNNRLLLLLVIFVLGATLAYSQEHAPTAPQCQADQRLWSSQSKLATAATGFDAAIRSYSLNELANRSREMLQCISVDPDHLSQYGTTAALILSQVERRLTRFVQETGQADKYAKWEAGHQKTK
jgi:hypothetical protein